MPSRLSYGCLAGMLAAAALQAAAPAKNSVTAVRFWSLVDTTRVVVETESDFEFRSDRVPDPDRVFFDLLDCRLGLGRRGRHSVNVGNAHLKQIRLAETQPGVTRVVFDLDEGIEYTASKLTNPSRLVVEFRRAGRAPVVVSKATEAVVAPLRSKSGRRVLTAADVFPPRRLPEPVYAGPGPAIPRQRAAAPALEALSRTLAPPPARPAAVRIAEAETRSVASGRTTSSAKPAKIGANSQSMTRVLGLKIGRIVLDPGHGGHDTGTMGAAGLLEKDLVLDVCKRLGALIEARMGAEVIFTRTDDTFVPLERRTEIANEHKADLFLSVHANSSPERTSSGVETFFLNFTTDPAVLQVAARENASSQKTVYELRDLVQKIALQDKVEESRQFAAKVQAALYAASLKANARTRNRGVKKAPFVVLIGASMPSVLAEIGFVSNPRDEALFQRGDYRQKLAEGLYRGILQYASSLSHFQVARSN